MFIGDDSAAATIEEEIRRERVADFILNQDDPDIIVDLRSLNGKPNSTKFDDFWNEVHVLFEEYQAAVHERRHDSVLYLPFAISTRELIDRVKKRKPNIEVPSDEWMRLQFSPKNPYSKNALKYSGRFPIKFLVQRRQMRSEHSDSKYGFIQYKYGKQFAVKYRENCIMVCADDKAVIPVGEPNHAVTSGVRAHNQSLGLASGQPMVALDHDWKVAGVVSSVNLFNDIPEKVDQSFFGGKVFTTVKDRIFEKSSPMRHAAELTDQIRNNFSNDGVTCSNEILFIYTDGGGDHNVTNPTVKISLLALFVHLDVDMLVAIRTCPTQSWVNPAERVMSILNFALQVLCHFVFKVVYQI